MWWLFNYLTIDIIVYIAVFCLFIYCVVKAKKKKYKFDGFGKYFPSFTKPKKKKKISEGEKTCRQIFEELFGVPFKTIRPNWLKNPITKRNLELDGYNATIKTPKGQGLAFEYDGEQHSKYNKRFHKNPQSFTYQCKRDTWKDYRCKELGIVLIRIPYYVIPINMRSYIIDILSKNGVKPPNIKV